MNRRRAVVLLQMDDRREVYTQKEIDSAYRKECRRYHPDSGLCTVSVQLAGVKMKELADAREFLITVACKSADIGREVDLNQVWNEEKQEWVNLATDIWQSGCLWDETVEMPMDRIVSMVTSSSFVDSMLTKVQQYCQEENRKYTK